MNIITKWKMNKNRNKTKKDDMKDVEKYILGKGTKWLRTTDGYMNPADFSFFAVKSNGLKYGIYAQKNPFDTQLNKNEFRITLMDSKGKKLTFYNEAHAILFLETLMSCM